MRKITKIQIATLVLIIGWIAWEMYMWEWSKTQIGAIIRVDLLLILPVMFVMIVLSILQFFQREN